MSRAAGWSGLGPILQRRLDEGVDPQGIATLFQAGQTVLGVNIDIGNPHGAQTRMRYKFEIRDNTNAQSLFDRFPDALAAADFQQGRERDIFPLGGGLECAACR